MKIEETTTIREELGNLTIDGEDVGRVMVEFTVRRGPNKLDSITGMGYMTYAIEAKPTIHVELL